jgi:hypothetical protein
LASGLTRHRLIPALLLVWISHDFLSVAHNFFSSRAGSPPLPPFWHATSSRSYAALARACITDSWLYKSIPSQIPPTSVSAWLIRSGNHRFLRRPSRGKVVMVNSGQRSTTASGTPLWMPLPPRMAPPVCGPAPNQPQQFMMPRLVSEGSHESVGGAEEIGVHLNRRRVVPPYGVGGWPL